MSTIQLHIHVFVFFFNKNKTFHEILKKFNLQVQINRSQCHVVGIVSFLHGWFVLEANMTFPFNTQRKVSSFSYWHHFPPLQPYSLLVAHYISSLNPTERNSTSVVNLSITMRFLQPWTQHYFLRLHSSLRTRVLSENGTRRKTQTSRELDWKREGGTRREEVGHREVGGRKEEKVRRGDRRNDGQEAETDGQKLDTRHHVETCKTKNA